MNKLERYLFVGLATVAGLAGLFAFYSIAERVAAHSDINTNISSNAGEFWGWNDIIGWIDFHNTHTVMLTGTKLKGYASSSAGYISFDCSTAPEGSTVCNQSPYKVDNDGSGNLTGWGWNDTYGWISFCGGENTSACPGNIDYQVQVNMANGIFRGDGDDYAWNDVIGWISFNNTNHSGSIPYKVIAGAGTSTVGSLESTPYDTGVSGGAQINSILWRGTEPTGTKVYFQFATSDSSSGPWSYIGPDGTANTYYGPVSVNSPYAVDYSLHNDKRYFKYKVVLYTDASQFRSPQIDEIIINWSP